MSENIFVNFFYFDFAFKPFVIDISSPPVLYNGKITAFSEFCCELTLDGSAIIASSTMDMKSFVDGIVFPERNMMQHNL